ncbi:MAG TPA: three-Cys-motif partner protein TcmP [Candidatus Angelobacter sp.]
MRPPEFYKGREQTYVKHFFFEKYLQTVAFHIGYSYPEFVCVDGFSGPWRTVGEDLSDTSFYIALDRLKYVKEGLAAQNKHPAIKAFFVEEDPKSFAALERAIQEYKGPIQAIPFRGTFQENIPKILDATKSAFAFFFIDPTGWTGFSMEGIKPVLRHGPGEVVINFMYDHINRFLNSTEPSIEASMDLLFGTDKWRSLRDVREDRENAIVGFYRERIRVVGGFQFVTSTRILKPTQDRAYFHLVYATRNPKGIIEFRAVEEKTFAEQERVRRAAKLGALEERTHQPGLPFESTPSPQSEVDRERARQIHRAESRVVTLLQTRALRYGQLRPQVLEIPLVWESDLQQILKAMRDRGKLEIEGLGSRERVIKPPCLLRLLRS